MDRFFSWQWRIPLLVCTPTRSVSYRVHHVKKKLRNIYARWMTLEVHLHPASGVPQHVDITVAIFPLCALFVRS